jgi:hypothetical protein
MSARRLESFQDSLAKVRAAEIAAHPLDWYADPKNVSVDVLTALEGDFCLAQKLLTNAAKAKLATQLHINEIELLTYEKTAAARFARATYTYILDAKDFVVPGDYDGLTLAMPYLAANFFLKDAGSRLADAHITKQESEAVNLKLQLMKGSPGERRSGTI